MTLQSSVLDARVIDELNANASDLRKRAEVLKIVFTQSTCSSIDSLNHNLLRTLFPSISSYMILLF